MDDDDIGRAMGLIPEKVITLIISRKSVVMKRAYRVFELRNRILQDYGASFLARSSGFQNSSP
ncbi:MAG: hypothetical protein R2744_13955 [Bacteroidales bacterium]